MLSVIILLFAGLAIVGFAHVSDISPNDALQKLYDGNIRFVKESNEHPGIDKSRRKGTEENGQHPYATVVACSDSRVPVEHIFDVGIGDIFSIRVAGNLAGVDQIASIEYAVAHLVTPILVILGHSCCGAVTAATMGAKEGGSLPWLLEQIYPAIVRAKEKNPGMQGEELVPKVIEENIWLTVEKLLAKSPIVKSGLKQGKVGIVGANYDIGTGAVKWMGSHPNQAMLLE